MDVMFFGSQSYFSSTQTSLQGKSNNKEKFSMSHLFVPATLPEQEHENQSSTDETCEPPTKLKVYFIRHKSMTAPYSPCQASL
jgi:hypothetical protein